MEYVTWTPVIFAVATLLLIIPFNLSILAFARRFGIGVEEVAFFYGNLMKLNRGNIIFKLGFLPLGGYVKMKGMLHPEEEVEGEEEKGEDLFRDRPLGQRIMVMAAPILSQFLMLGLFLLLRGGNFGDNFQWCLDLLETLLGREGALSLDALFTFSGPLDYFFAIASFAAFFIAIGSSLPIPSMMGGQIIMQFFSRTSARKFFRRILSVGMLALMAGYGYLIWEAGSLLGWWHLLVSLAIAIFTGFALQVLVWLAILLLVPKKKTAEQ